MKKIMSFLLLIVMVISFSACTRIHPSEERQSPSLRIKCPSCGYEFLVPEN
jgi:hypothetical protein